MTAFRNSRKRFCNNKCGSRYRYRHLAHLTQREKEERLRRKWGMKPRVLVLIDGVTTIAELQEKFGYLKSRIKIQKHARLIFLEHGMDRACLICGYTRHVQACHRDPVSSFPKTTIISEINNPENMVGLCPNHHWEFDNGFITKEDIAAAEARVGAGVGIEPTT